MGTLGQFDRAGGCGALWVLLPDDAEDSRRGEMLKQARGADGQGSYVGAQPRALFVVILVTLLCNRRQHVSI